MTREEIMEMVRDEIQTRCNLLVKSDNHDLMLYHTYCATGIKVFWKMQINHGMQSEFEKELDKMINDAYDKYYEKAKEDFKSAHKRLY